VRRSFLCGVDPLTGKNFDHRKQWIAERMKLLGTVFAVDICSYGLMSNHFHDYVQIVRFAAKAIRAEKAAAVPTGVAARIERRGVDSIRWNYRRG